MQFLKKYYLVYLFLFAFFAGSALLFSRTVGQWLPVSDIRSDDRTTVIIDPGHGGEDGGAVSPLGTRECELNLQISLRINDLFRFLGVRTAMTRSEDVSIYDSEAKTVSEKKVSDLKNRAKLVNSIPNGLFLSIHQNMFSDGKYSGAQVFFAQTEGSQALAEQLQLLLREQVDPGNRREAKPSSAVWLMEHIDCTGVLVECGFLSNTDEEQRLKTETYQKKLSAVIACTVTQYLTGETEKNEV